MTKLAVATIILLAVVAAGQPGQSNVAMELKKLQGTWRLVTELDDGKPTPAEKEGVTRLTFDGAGNWKVELDGKLVGRGTSTFDPDKKPKTVDYTSTQGEAAGAKFIAIYELDGQTFRHCGVLSGARPTEFSSTPGSGQILTTFRRDKND